MINFIFQWRTECFFLSDKRIFRQEENFHTRSTIWGRSSVARCPCHSAGGGLHLGIRPPFSFKRRLDV